MPQDPFAPLRSTLASQLRTSQAHAGLERILSGIPENARGRRVNGSPHTIWRLLDHMRRTAEDLVAYVRAADYEAPPWPAGYWPEGDAPPSSTAWDESLRGLRQAVEAMAAMVEDPSRDLFAQAPAAERDGHHLVRCALVLLDHDSHHLGQIITLRRELGVWPPAS